MYGNLHEFDIRSLLELMEWGQYTGQLLINPTVASENDKTFPPLPTNHPFWLLSLSNGQITYAVDSNHLQLQRLQDYLRPYQVESALERLPKVENVPRPTNCLRTIGRTLPEYNYLWILLEHHVLNGTQAKQILQHIVYETLFDLLSLSQGYFIFESNILLEPQLTTLAITPALSQVTRQLQQWKQLYPYISSPEQCPLLIKNDELQKALTASAYRSLAVACQGQLTLRRIARYLNKDLVTISQALYPYIQRGWLQMLAEEETYDQQEFPEKNPNASEPSQEIVCISQDQEVNEQLAAILQQEGYIPVIIDDPIAALSAVARSQPQLIFCALELSTSSGEQLTQTLKTLPTLAKTPIIILTSETTNPTRLVKAQLLGATACLTQPIDKSELLKLLKLYLHPSQVTQK